METRKTHYYPTHEEERVASAIVQAAYDVHVAIGPGLLEKIYESCLIHLLEKKGFDVRKQVIVPIKFQDLIIEDGLRLDILINDLVICELKAVDAPNPVFDAQVLSYLKMTGKHLGFLINFNVPFINKGIKRFIL